MGVGVGVGVVGESGLGAGSAVTDLGRTGGGVKVFRCAAMMIRARSGRSPCAAVEPLLCVRRAALVVSLVTSTSRLRR